MEQASIDLPEDQWDALNMLYQHKNGLGLVQYDKPD